MHKVFKSLVCVVTAVVVFVFSCIPASAEITYEQEMLIYFNSNSDDYEQGIPYLPSYFQNLYGWGNCKSNWETFIANSTYSNRFYFTRILYDGKTKYFYIINYDYISYYSSVSVKFNKCIVAHFTTSVGSDYESVNLTLQGNYDADTTDYSFSCNINYSGFTIAYYSFSVDGKTLILDDGEILTEDNSEDSWSAGLLSMFGLTDDYDFSSNWFGEVSVLDGLLDLKTGFSNDLSNKLSTATGMTVQVGDDYYSDVLSDLVNGVFGTSSGTADYSNLGSDYISNIQQTYDRFYDVVTNNVNSYTNDDGDYYYSENNEGDYVQYITDGGDTTNYYNTYIYSDVSSDDDTTTTGGGSSSNGNGAYAEANANAEGGNAEINQGDIVINVPSSDSDSTSNDNEDDIDVDISSFERLVDRCSTFISFVQSFFGNLDSDIKLAFTSLIAVVVVCRICGR